MPHDFDEFVLHPLESGPSKRAFASGRILAVRPNFIMSLQLITCLKLIQYVPAYGLP